MENINTVVSTSISTFDTIMQYCPYLKETIENKISEEIEKATEEKDKEIQELKTTIDGLTASMLMGGK